MFASRIQLGSFPLDLLPDTRIGPVHNTSISEFRFNPLPANVENMVSYK